MRPYQLCDGVLVSLAQHLGTKGLLKRVDRTSLASLAPRSVRKHFGLAEDQWAFGDCGAFTYVGEPAPTISVEQAVALYDFHEFDFGASVDHIPIAEIPNEHGRILLTSEERQGRVVLTRDNADRFFRVHRQRSAHFIPVGVIQGVYPDDYADQLGDYLDMGYRYLALGGLVPRSDGEIAEIVQAVYDGLKRVAMSPWIHLLGIFRPRLQGMFKAQGINSFDSASYFRKAWLRSSQNYLGSDGRWYAAIRVPPSHDPRTLMRLRYSGYNENQITRLEGQALQALRAYDRDELSADACLSAVLDYDRLLARADLMRANLVAAYRRTLMCKPWRQCRCPMCQSLGIDIVIFRGLNRNKRRGAHNTLMLYQQVQGRAV